MSDVVAGGRTRSESTVSVRLFAFHAEAMGADSVSVTVDAPVTVGALRAALRGRGGVLAGTGLIAVNAEYAGDDRLIAPGDEVALIPPVAGG